MTAQKKTKQENTRLGPGVSTAQSLSQAEGQKFRGKWQFEGRPIGVKKLAAPGWSVCGAVDCCVCEANPHRRLGHV